MNLLNIFLMGPAAEGGDNTSLFLMLGLMAVVFYFFMFRPQAKRAKELKNFRESIQKGTKVVTVGGVHGKVVGVQDSTLLIEVEGGNKLKIEKSAVGMEYTSGSEESEVSESSTGQKK